MLPSKKLDKHERGTSNQSHQQTLWKPKGIPSGPGAESVNKARKSSNSSWSIVQLISSVACCTNHKTEPVEHIAKHLRAGDVSGLPHVLGKWFSKTKFYSWFIFVLQRMALCSCNKTENQHKFLVATGTLSTPTSSQSNVFDLFAFKRRWRPPLHVPETFDE